MGTGSRLGSRTVPGPLQQCHCPPLCAAFSGLQAQHNMLSKRLRHALDNISQNVVGIVNINNTTASKLISQGAKCSGYLCTPVLAGLMQMTHASMSTWAGKHSAMAAGGLSPPANSMLPWMRTEPCSTTSVCVCKGSGSRPLLQQRTLIVLWQHAPVLFRHPVVSHPAGLPAQVHMGADGTHHRRGTETTKKNHMH